MLDPFLEHAQREHHIHICMGFALHGDIGVHIGRTSPATGLLRRLVQVWQLEGGMRLQRRELSGKIAAGLVRSILSSTTVSTKRSRIGVIMSVQGKSRSYARKSTSVALM